VEQQQPPVSSLTPVAPGPATTPASATPPAADARPPEPTGATESWPAVPPAPVPVKPAPPPASPEPPLLLTPPPVTPIRFPSGPVPPPRAAAAEEEAPTIAIAIAPGREDPTAAVANIPGPAPGATARGYGRGAGAAWTDESSDEGASEEGRRRPVGRAARASEASAEGTESPLLQLQRSVRRQQVARAPGKDLVWQPRFAYSSALIILFALTVVSMPLWIVLYRITDTATGGPPVADLVALCMMLLGGFLTGAAAWVIIIEMRGRVRMVDTLAKTGEREAMIAPELPVLDAPLDMSANPVGRAREPVWDPDAAAASYQARVEAQQVNAASMLEASSKLLSAFSTVLRSFGQLPAQVAMLAVALALFVGATVLSLR